MQPLKSEIYYFCRLESSTTCGAVGFEYYRYDQRRFQSQLKYYVEKTEANERDAWMSFPWSSGA